MALAVSLEHYAEKNNSPEAAILGEALDDATEAFLENDKSPSRKVNEIDTRGSHFYLAFYWAKELSKQEKSQELKATFERVYAALSDNKDKILQELLDAQGSKQDIGGYYLPKNEEASKAMRPSETFNKVLEGI